MAYWKSILVMAVMFSGFVTRGQEARKSSEPYWDGVYSQNRPIFSLRPTELLRYAVKDRPPGKALDIGMGQGRNAIFLAQQRWEVTGFDPSVEGVRQAQETAHQLRLHLNASVAREEAFDLGREKWDLIVVTYVRRLNVEDANRLQRALKRSGILVYENNNVGELNELLRAFLGFRILRFEDVEAHADWHPDKKQRVERLVCEKP
jgi:2-polyprenyl-3-methyl-5-hydroxy-6-metoxy-1,4-benzoquinol methylase